MDDWHYGRFPRPEDSSAMRRAHEEGIKIEKREEQGWCWRMDALGGSGFETAYAAANAALRALGQLIGEAA